jgi:hypothetical protein
VQVCRMHDRKPFLLSLFVYAFSSSVLARSDLESCLTCQEKSI